MENKTIIQKLAATDQIKYLNNDQIVAMAEKIDEIIEVVNSMLKKELEMQLLIQNANKSTVKDA
jgi:hypothetical protein